MCDMPRLEYIIQGIKMYRAANTSETSDHSGSHEEPETSGVLITITQCCEQRHACASYI